MSLDNTRSKLPSASATPGSRASRKLTRSSRPADRSAARAIASMAGLPSTPVMRVVAPARLSRIAISPGPQPRSTTCPAGQESWPHINHIGLVRVGEVGARIGRSLRLTIHDFRFKYSVHCAHYRLAPPRHPWSRIRARWSQPVPGPPTAGLLSRHVLAARTTALRYRRTPSGPFAAYRRFPVFSAPWLRGRCAAFVPLTRAWAHCRAPSSDWNCTIPAWVADRRGQYSDLDCDRLGGPDSGHLRPASPAAG